MDLNSIVIGVVILALLAVAAMYFAFNERRKSNGRLRQFTDLGAQHGLEISLCDFWHPGHAIGIDTSKKRLLYVKASAEKEEVITVDLSDVRNCSLLHEYRDQNGTRVIDLIGLHFTFRSSKALQTLLFYSREEDLHLREELQLAEKWKGIVCSSLPGTSEGAAADKRPQPVTL
ncbi:hypothetical protein [Pontibacter akesuensis]|uniref:Uncharacterized protein n=1 Tax=Pontibacter akesuensis TaxID=388950 RepID=A0A1I7KX37_9BACT|nr:hypothetical protein [Pontibacter akesuensis]GHA78644.1 hypothetical protein GCM10007389_36090 [Pontibacter akesuensis]SFV01985.1 hypothetical protein SAMN04487941_0054 [Pontibacter akesuensis]